MPPQLIVKKVESPGLETPRIGRDDVDAKIPSLTDIKNALPEEVFQKSLGWSLYYTLRDYVMLACGFIIFYALVTSSTWQSWNIWQKALAHIVYCNYTGFYMWTTFMIGHDCGHGSFSSHDIVNDVVGSITHTLLAVPYFPWQLSHRRHHLGHNHIEKDYSHPWLTTEMLDRPDRKKANFVSKRRLIKAVLPFVMWTYYLLGGGDDGSHFYPTSSSRLWKSTPEKEKRKCLLSSALVIGSLAFIYHLSGSLFAFWFYYVAPLFVFHWWLVTVTYLQHHRVGVQVYDNSNWSFVRAAFETVDRTFGWGVDDLHHNITDGHVIHHLFFTKIPHYHLKKATQALKEYLVKRGCLDLYLHEETRMFPVTMHKMFIEHFFLAKLVK